MCGPAVAGLLDLEVPAIAHPPSVRVLGVALRFPLEVSVEQLDVCVLFLPPLCTLLLSSGVVTMVGGVLAWASDVYDLSLGSMVCHRSPWLVLDAGCPHVPTYDGVGTVLRLGPAFSPVRASTSYSFGPG